MKFDQLAKDQFLSLHRSTNKVCKQTKKLNKMETSHNVFNPLKPLERPTYAQKPYQTPTPCTRLSRMVITSDRSSFERPSKSFQERIMEATEREALTRSGSCLDEKKQTSERKRRLSFFSEDEDESDGGDAFSSDACILSSPAKNYIYPRFSDEILLSSSSLHSEFDSEDEFGDMGYYDPSDSWLNQVYCNNSPVNADRPLFQTEDEDQNGENKPPVPWNSQEQKRPRPFDTEERRPLQEIVLEDKEGFPSKKRLLENFKKTDAGLLRTISPSIFTIKGKGESTA
ncbi:hypothetical protein BY458DRAFT_494704 [Sporodiniella umbellata]|nr:hypothetical protein BY458DRAFT_494704 [Sporodiniella umbellata]